MRFQSDFYALATQIEFQSVFCVTRNVTHSDDVKSRVTEVHQSSWAESMLLPAERFGGHHREQPRLDSVIVWRAR